MRISIPGISCALFIAFILFSGNAKAQSYINFSKYTGGTSGDSASRMIVVNGETFLMGTTTSTNFPVTNGSTHSGKRDLTLSKYNSSGAVVYSTYLGGKGDEYMVDMKVVSGEVYIIGTTDSSGYPVTNGTAHKGSSDMFITRLGTTGNIVFSTYLGGSGSDFLPAGAIQLVGNELFLAGSTSSLNFPVTGGSVYNGGSSDGFITKMNATTGAIISSRFWGSNKIDNISAMAVENGNLYFAGSTESGNLPITIGNPGAPTGRHIYAAKLNSSTFASIYSRYIGGSREDFMSTGKVVNGELHMTGFTYSPDFPVTNGSTPSGLPDDSIDGFYTRLNSDGTMAFSTYLSTSGLDILSSINLDNGTAYIAGISIPNNGNSTFPNQDIMIHKINSNGSISYSKRINNPTGNASFPSFKAVNNELYFSGITSAPDYPVTNNSQFYSGGTGYFTSLDAAGNVKYSSFLGKMNTILPLQYVNNKFYLLGSSDAPTFTVTDSSKTSGGTDNLLMILNEDGSTHFSTYIGGGNNEYPTGMMIDNNDIYFSGKTYSNNYPVTNTTTYQGTGDAFLTKLSFCPAQYDVANDTLSAKVQTVCKYGLAKKISGRRIFVPGSNLPAIYLNGVADLQKGIEATYQWQIADAPTGPFTNIPSATLKDYTPVIGGIAQYYRRLAFSLPICGSTPVHISDTASVLVNSLTAPTVNAGGPFVTCPTSPITIGGTPTATGGNAPYTSYVWDMGAGNISNPEVSPSVSTIYTVVVTDAMGCQQAGQALVYSFAADAGSDKRNCAGNPVTIGTPQVPGVAGLQYNWSPNIAINNINIAQPTVNPSTPTDYTLTLTIAKSGGGTCTTQDVVNVVPVEGPVTATPAGPDRVICLGSDASLGTATEADFTYTWSPGQYLTSNNTSLTTYFPGNIVMPAVNPAYINLSMQKNGCTFTDQVVVSTIESRAGLEGCGPRIVGLPDRTPNINETYNWIKISGPGNFTGATNLPQVPVSASVGGTTVYGLIVTYNGHACFSTVSVPEICQGCLVLIAVDAKYKCPSYGINGNDVTLTALSSVGEATYSWTPQVGLSNYNTAQVKLTDNVARQYTVTVTSIYDPELSCQGTVEVNNPAFSIPVFPAPDAVVCASTPTQIGAPPVSGYVYEWTGTGLSDNFISNPLVTIPFETSYPVKISDNNGCELTDTVLVKVQNVNADAGPDWIICSNGIATLGTPAQPNTTYSWEPSASPWQNGTNQASAQPQVLAITDLSFTLNATTSAGCISSDVVQLTINNSPTIPDAPDVTVCAGHTVMIGSPALPGVSYQWTPATGLNDATLAQPLASPSVNTLYTLVATFPGNCALPATDQVLVKASTAAFSMPDINFCPDNGAVALGNAAPANMTSYYWSPAYLVTDASLANPSTFDPPPSIPTTFTLEVRSPDGCMARDTMVIIPSVPKPDAGVDKTICKNASTVIGSAANTTSPGITYSWSPVINLSDPLSGQPTFTGTTGGIFSYILTKTDNNLSCIAKDTVIIKVIDSLLPLISTASICQNSCVQIGTSPLPGIQYQWTPVTGLSNPSIANPVVCAGTSTLSYTLTATDLNGCSATSNIVVGVNSVPAAHLSVTPLTACVGATHVNFNPVITPAGNYSYLWSPDDGTLSDIHALNPTVFVTDAGTKQYQLQVTDNNTFCTNTVTATLNAQNCAATATVGDLLWFDINENGIRNAEDLGVNGATVKLYNNVDLNVATTATDANGNYSFLNVTPGNGYYIIFSKPSGYIFTLQNVGGINADNNSKADQSGRTNPFDVVAGIDRLNIDAGIRPSGVTPVTLLNFTGTLRNRQVLLNWQTTAEYNNHYFDVEKSTDGIHFTFIGRVNGHGTTTLPHSYSLIDPSPATGMNYYRLRQIDLDGRANLSNVVAIRLIGEQNIIVTYNSQVNQVKIKFPEKQPATYFNLYADNGQLIQSSTATNISEYNLRLSPVISKGIYVLQIVNAGMNKTEKIFVR
ncbi:SdrD B-like domain-containing protein [Ferruginibacter sp. HRS2-29]|uniref:SdrD B-like domain-containing protein n=1 Tax=Ferruginibacter sp. HRS2-29 TaxID=2487334 RepID=UPI0020CD682E|nr:SdrD B-like domain-containing protein [Ferruginibacter sp. HRS2-29]MCP9753205.1 hypothetical protein [Ferruginibacter sp. HRS2-29]